MSPETAGKGKSEDIRPKRRGVLRYGALASGVAGASAASGLFSGSAQAAPPVNKDPSTSYIPNAEKGVASGVATLDSGSRLPITQMPDLSSNTAIEVSEPGKAARTALDALYVQRANLFPNAKDHGARGDNSSRPLSTTFATLTEAQAVYPAASALTDELDWAVIQSLINAYGGVYLPQGTYYINKTIAATSTTIVGDRRMPRLFMTASDLPILSLKTNANVSYLRLTYSTQQTSAHTNSDAIRLYNINGALFEKVRIDFPARGIFNYGGGYTFSSTFRDVAIGYYSITAFDIRNSGGITGNVVNNLYTHNNPISESVTNVSSEPPVQLGGWDDGVLMQINVEHTQASAAMAIGNCLNLSIMGLHVEGFTLLGNFNAVVNTFSGNTQVSVTGMSVIFSKFLIEHIPSSDSCALFKITDGIKLLVQNLQERNNTISSVGAAFVFNSSGTTSATVIAQACKLSGFGSNTAGDATKVSTIAVFNNSRNYDLQNGKYTIFQDAAPTNYSWAVGDSVKVRNIAESGNAGSKYMVTGYRCVTAGTPGKWLPERVLTGN